MYDLKALYEAGSAADAIRLLTEHPEAKIIAGGSDVLVQMREGKLAGYELVSIQTLDELRGVRLDDDGTLRILPLTSFSHVTRNPLIQKYIPVLGEAVDMVGGPQIRNIGTIGGNVCNGVTSADSASSLWALNATLELRGVDGTRMVPIRSFYTGPGKTMRGHDEVLAAIHIKKEDYDGFGGCYIKYGKREAMEIATLGCAAMARLTDDKAHIAELRLAYGVAAPTPMRCVNTEEAVRGAKIDAALFDRIAAGATGEVTPRSSWRASRDFRLQLVSELSRRAVKQAILNAGGKADV